MSPEVQYGGLSSLKGVRSGRNESRDTLAGSPGGMVSSWELLPLNPP